MRLPHDRRIQVQAVLGIAPSLSFAVIALIWRDCPWWVTPILAVLAMGATLVMLARIRSSIRRPLGTLSNLLAALREGDYASRARMPAPDDPLSDVYRELNTLADLLLHQRTRAIEAAALARAVMAEIEVGVFAFDAEDRLRLVNRAGEGLLRQPQERILGQPARSLGLGPALEDQGEALVDLVFPGRAGRFEVRTSTFRQGGRVHRLLVVSDLTRPLREEERRAWQKLTRVLGHEINNSLAPMQSLAGSLATLVERQEEGWRDDLRQGLAIIESRAVSLNRFMERYARLARLPEPKLAPVAIAPLVRKVAAMETRVPVDLCEGPEVTLPADADQLEQALINLCRNAAEASLERNGRVRLSWQHNGNVLELRVEDQGPGLPGGGNLFVPFFTTKPNGNGIGLVLSRQIAEGHNGSLRLENRDEGGARAVVKLPMAGQGERGGEQERA